MWKLILFEVALLTSHTTPATAAPPGPEGRVASANPAPARTPSVAGCWDLVIKMPFLHPNQRGRLSLLADGRLLRGTVNLHGTDFEVRDGVIDGSRIRFSIDRSEERAQFEGDLRGPELRGSMIKAGRRLSWTATRCRAPGR